MLSLFVIYHFMEGALDGLLQQWSDAYWKAEWERYLATLED